MSNRTLMRKEERVENILAAAARAFGHGGYAATAMDDIAAEAGVTKLILYRHFDGKQELYEAVLARVSEHLRTVFLERVGQGDPAAGLRALLTVARHDLDSFLLLFRHAAREPQFAAYAEGYLARMRTAAERMLDSVVHDGVVVHWVSRAMVAMAVESVIAWLEAGRSERDEDFLARAYSGLRAMIDGAARA